MSDDPLTPPSGTSRRDEPSVYPASDGRRPVEDTQEVPVEDTRSLPVAGPGASPHGAGPDQAAGTDWADRPGLDPTAYPQHSGQRDPGAHAYPPPTGQQPYPYPAPSAGGPGSTAPGPGGGGARGVSWPLVIAVAAVTALLAGLLGGLGGGLLAATQGWRLRDGGSGSIPTAGAGATQRPPGSVANIAARALPSVVTIKVQGADGSGTGSGFVLDRGGHIITNNHVIDAAADSGKIRVQLSNGDETDATIVGRDTSYDLAVLKTSRTDLTPLVMGRSEEVVVGDPVIAVGAPLGLDSTVTTGIVSALNRPVTPGGGNSASYISAIQTDAAINPGNSGGPLLNGKGEVIGVNSAIAAVPGAGQQSSGNIGVGFAIPSDQVRRTAEQLIRTGKAEHPVIGVMLDTNWTGSGVRIAEEGSNGQRPITPGGPADKAGLRPGDVIVEFDGKRVIDPDSLIVAIRAKNVGDRVSLTVQRGSERREVTMTLQGSD